MQDLNPFQKQNLNHKKDILTIHICFKEKDFIYFFKLDLFFLGNKMSHNSTSHLISFYLCKFRNWYKLMFYLNFLLTNKQFFIFICKGSTWKKVLKKISNLQIKKMLFRFDEQLLQKKRKIYLNYLFFFDEGQFFYDIQFTLIILSATLNPTWKLNWPVFTVLKEQKKKKIRESFPSNNFIVSCKPLISLNERMCFYEIF